MAEYCQHGDLGRHGVNEDALADLSIDEKKRPAIRAASDLMDSYLRAQFQLPLLSWGDDIVACCAVLAAWELLRVRGVKPGESSEDNALFKAYDAKIKWLQQIAGGTVHPEVTDSSSGASPGTTTAARPVLTSNEQRGYYSNDPTRAGPFVGRRS